MRVRVLSLLLRPTAPPLALGLVVAPLLIAAESLVVYLLQQVAPGNLFGVVFLLGVLVVSIGWGFGLGTMTALASALVYAYFHHLQTGGSFIPTDARNWVAVTVFLVVALSATTLAGVARLRAAVADQRRREVEASHDELSVLAEHQAALRRVATLVARGVTPSELFSAVAEELARCLGVYHHAVLFRYEPDGAGILLTAGHGDRGIKAIPVGERFSLEGDSVAARVFRTCRAARMVRNPIRCPPIPRRASGTSRIWSRRRLLTPRPAPSSASSPSNRQPCGAWRHWSRAGSSRLKCSLRWRRSWPGAWGCTTRRCGATTPTARARYSRPTTTTPV
jgi:hypothetical protein